MRAIITIILLTFSLHAASLSTNKTTYTAGENVVVSLTGVTGQYSNWVGIFRQGSANTWNNVVDAIWFYRADSLTFVNLPGGNYVARLFYKDNLNLVASSNNFSVSAGQITLGTDRASYNNGETIEVTVGNVQASSQNFVGIYPQGSANDWGHVGAKWFNFRDGTIEFENINLPQGNYEMRLIYNNDVSNPKKSSNFTVGDIQRGDISTNKQTYNSNEAIEVTVSNVQGTHNNWVGIFRAGSPNDWGYVLAENWFNFTDGTITFPQNFSGGNYEARLFYNDSLTVEKVASFKIKKAILPPTVYEDAENGNTAGWYTMEGPYNVKNVYRNGTRAIFGKAKWINGQYYNSSYYRLILDNGNYWNNTSQHILDMDINGHTACFKVGVEARTSQGYRGVFFSIWYGKHNYPASKDVYGDYTELTFPMPESYRHGNNWKHFRVDIEAKIKELEPDNELISIESFVLNGMTGYGAIDNIKLLSQ